MERKARSLQELNRVTCNIADYVDDMDVRLSNIIASNHANHAMVLNRLKNLEADLRNEIEGMRDDVVEEYRSLTGMQAMKHLKGNKQ